MFQKLLALGSILVLASCSTSHDAKPERAASAQPAGGIGVAPLKYPQRWVGLGGSCTTTESTDALIAKLKNAKDAGCTHIMLGEGGTGRLENQKPEYFQNARRVQDFAKQNGLTLAVSMVSVGYSGTYYHYDTNFAAGHPVKNVRYLVKGQTAKPDPTDVLGVKNTSFNEVVDGKLVGWQDAPVSLLDSTVNRNGKPSLKGGRLLTQIVPCEPFKYYRATWYVKGPKPEDDEGYFLRLNSTDSDRRQSYTEATVHPADKDGWAKYEVPFNTFEATSIRVGFGGGKAGQNWFSDLKIEPAGMLLLVQAPRIPLVVTSEDGKTVYEQGKDFKHIEDPIMAVRPFPGDAPIDHEAPAIELTPQSRIHDGDTLRVSFFHHMRVYTEQDAMSLSEPAIWPILERQIKMVTQAWPTGHYMLAYDEIRGGAWDPMPDPSIKTPGQLLAWHFRKSYDLVRKYAPGSTIYTWSDMFTPYHNAGDKPRYYYYVNGNWSGAGKDFPKDVVVMQWYAPTPQAMRYFADNGNKQIICGFYDDKTTEGMKKNIQQWVDVSKGVSGIQGYMYTTFANNYASMPEYFKLLDTYAKWSKSATAPADKMIMHGVDDR